MNRTDEMWHPDDGDFPAEGSPGEVFAFLVRYAILAPSSHNSQPWRFRVEGDELELLLDRSRALPVVDPELRELVMSCGAALFHLRVALRRFGYRGEVATLPDPDWSSTLGPLRTVPDLLARVRLGPAEPPSPEIERLFDAIPRRRTNRFPFLEESFSSDLLEALAAAAEREGAWLHIVEDDRREALTDLIAEADRLQFADPHFRSELAAWLRPNFPAASDGMPGYALGLGELESLLGPFVVRTFDRGDGQAARDRELAEGSPLLAVLGTMNDRPGDWLNAGQALDRVLLRGRASNLSASYLNQPLELPELRPRVAKLVGRDGHPQAVLRMGIGPEVRPTPRRPVEEVLERGDG